VQVTLSCNQLVLGVPTSGPANVSGRWLLPALYAQRGRSSGCLMCGEGNLQISFNARSDLRVCAVDAGSSWTHMALRDATSSACLVCSASLVAWRATGRVGGFFTSPESPCRLFSNAALHHLLLTRIGFPLRHPRPVPASGPS